MKLNKKLLMAALAGAIVVGGGVSTYAEEASNQFTSPEYKATTKEEKDKELAAAKEAALAKLDRLGITSDMIKKQINSAKTSAGVDSLVETVVKSTGKAEKEETEETPKYNNLFDKHELGGLGKDKGPGRFDEFGWESNEHGYDTYENAKKAAEKALGDKEINKSYTIRQGFNGKYYYVLSTEEPETPKKPEEKKPEDKRPKMTIDQWLLKNAKEDAIAELKKAGITSDFYFNAINKAKTVEGVNALKNEILKAHAGKEVNPSTPEVTPSVPENHYFENDYANIGAGKGTKEDGKKEESKENGKKEDSKEESKENGKKEDSKQESKENGKKEQKPGKEEKPAKEGKENTDSPNKKKKEKAALPKAGSEAEILTLAAASLSSVAGAFISLKKRK